MSMCAIVPPTSEVRTYVDPFLGIVGLVSTYALLLCLWRYYWFSLFGRKPFP